VSPVRRAQFAKHRFDVRLYCPDREAQRTGHALVTEAKHHPPQDVELTTGERLPLLDALRDAAGDQGSKNDATVAHQADAVQDLGDATTLQ